MSDETVSDELLLAKIATELQRWKDQVSIEEGWLCKVHYSFNKEICLKLSKLTQADFRKFCVMRRIAPRKWSSIKDHLKFPSPLAPTLSPQILEENPDWETKLASNVPSERRRDTNFDYHKLSKSFAISTNSEKGSDAEYPLLYAIMRITNQNSNYILAVFHAITPDILPQLQILRIRCQRTWILSH